jgi:hypothetical protein
MTNCAVNPVTAGTPFSDAQVIAPASELRPRAPFGRSPFTADAMAAYAGVLATFTGTSDDDTIDASGEGTINGFSGGSVTDLQDSAGDTFYGGSGNDLIYTWW